MGEILQKGYWNLFIESSYSTAQYLNLWMKEKDDKILDEIFYDLKGTQTGTDANRAFYKYIKTHYQKTIFLRDRYQSSIYVYWNPLSYVFGGS